MKIRNTNETKMKRIDEIYVDDTFMAERKDKKEGAGIYMKVDGNNGVFSPCYSKKVLGC